MAPTLVFIVGPSAVGQMAVGTEYASIFLDRDGRVLYVELAASQSERLRRNETEPRLAEKPPKRDLALSRHNLIDADAKYRLNSAGEFDGRADWLRIDNTAIAAGAVAERIVARFALARTELVPRDAPG